MHPWLTRDDVESVVSIPASLNVEDKLTPYLTPALRRLSGLLSATTYETLRGKLVTTAPVYTELETRLLPLVRKFLVNAAWSGYVLSGNVVYSQSGPVEKDTDTSSPISDVQRSQLSKYYAGEADAYALLIAAELPKDTCAARPGVTQPRARAIRGGSRSAFDSPECDRKCCG